MTIEQECIQDARYAHKIHCIGVLQKDINNVISIKEHLKEIGRMYLTEDLDYPMLQSNLKADQLEIALNVLLTQIIKEKAR